MRQQVSDAISSTPFDLLVVGSGMAGMTAAARAAQDEARVLVVDRATALGGTSAISAGYVWTTESVDAFFEEDPDADPVLLPLMCDEFLPGIVWMQGELGIDVGERITGIYRFGHGFRIDITDYLDRCTQVVRHAGGELRPDTTITDLRRKGDAVIGAVATSADGGVQELNAHATVLATGGFQGSDDLRVRYLGDEARSMLLRSRPQSDGAGLRLGLSVDAQAVGADGGFYGHLIASPLQSFETEDFIALAMLHSGYCVLVNELGARFTDESLGDHSNNQEVLRQPGSRAILIGDEVTRRERMQSAYIEGMEQYDKLALARAKGARVASAPTLDELIDTIGSWGVDATRALETLHEYNALARKDPGQLEPPSEKFCQAIETPPFFAFEVQPSITFPYGGLAVDSEARVMGTGGPIEGLYAAGADVGGISTRAYAGGLARGLVFGLAAARSALGRERATSPR